MNRPVIVASFALLLAASAALAQTPDTAASQNPSSASAKNPSSSSASPANAAMNKQAQEKRTLTDCVTGKVANDSGITREAAMRACKSASTTTEAKRPTEPQPAR